MVSASWIYLTIGVFFAASFLIAHYGRMKTGKGLEEYFIAGRRLGGIVSAFTYSATTYSAFMMIGLVGFTYVGGVGALGFELIYLMGLMVAVMVGLRFYAAGRLRGYVTPAQFLGDRYENRFASVVMAAACLVFLVPYMSVQLVGPAYLINTLSGGQIPFVVGVLFMGFVIAAYTWWGGMRAVAWTDALQASMMITLALILLFFVIQIGLGGFGSFFSALETEYPELLVVPGPGKFFNFPKFLGLTLPWFFFSITNPQVVQRFFVPKSVWSLKNMFRGFLVFGFIYTIIVTLLGLAAKILLPDLANPDLAMPSLLTLVPAPLALLVMVGILAAAVSTVDSILLSLSSMTAVDLYKGLRPGASELGGLRVGKATVLIMAAVIVAFSIRPAGLLVELSVMSSAGLLQFVPAVLGGFFWKRSTAAGAVSSILVGISVVGFLYFTRTFPLGHWPGVWGILCSSIVFVVVSFLTRPPKRVERFIDILSRKPD